MVSFETFWQRLKLEFERAEGPEPGVHVLGIQKWSQFRGDFSGKFVVVYRDGNNYVDCETETTNNSRNVGAKEFRKVYEVWDDYRKGRTKRKVIVHELGVHNSSWIIPILYRFENLMD